jgi:hypothetical protein
VTEAGGDSTEYGGGLAGQDESDEQGFCEDQETDRAVHGQAVQAE